MTTLASPSIWRNNHPYTSRVYLYVYTPVVIFRASVNQTTFVYPLGDFEIDNVTLGAVTDLIPDMLVRVLSQAGVFKGYARIRRESVSTTIWIGVVSQGEIYFENDDVIEALDDYRIMAKIPRILNDGTLVKDHEEFYEDQGSEPDPICNAGPFRIGFVDEDDEMSEAFDLTGSIAMAAGATIDAYAGDIGDGAVSSGSIASGEFTAVFPLGVRWCHFEVEDSNEKTHTKHIFVAALQKTGNEHTPTPVIAGSLRLDVSGAEAEFELIASDLSDDVLVKGALCILFAEEKYGTVAGSLNASDPTNAHILFVGWVREEGVEINPETSDVTVRCVGPAGRLAELPGFTQTTKDDDTPEAWHKIKDHTLWRHLWYLMHWHSTLLNICDIEEPPWLGTYPSPYPILDATEAPIYEQINQSASYMNAQLTACRQGRLYLRRMPHLMTDAERNALAVIVTLQSSDWMAVNIPQNHHPRTHWVRGSGWLASASELKPMLSIAPGKSPGQGPVAEPFDRNLVNNQADLNIRTGHQFAYRNRPRPNETIQLINPGLIAEPAWREWGKFALDSGSNRRGIEHTTSERFVITEVNINFEEGEPINQTWTVEYETSGQPGSTVEVKTGAIDDIYITPPPAPRPDDLYAPPIAPGNNLAFTAAPAVYVLDYDGGFIARTRTQGGAAEWEKFIQTSDLDHNIIVHKALDSWKPKHAMYLLCAQHGGGFTSEYAIYYVENLDGAVGTQTISLLHTRNVSDATFPFGSIWSSINIQGGVYAGHTFPGGAGHHMHAMTGRDGYAASWRDEAAFGVHGASDPDSMAIDHHAASIVSGKMAMADATNLYESPDMGNSWAVATGLGAPVGGLHYPFNDNPAGNILYVWRIADGSAHNMWRRESDGTTYTPITPTISGHGYAGPGIGPLACLRIHTYTQDRQILSAIGTAWGGFGGWWLFNSDDGGDTWDTPIEVFPSIQMPGLGGWPYDPNVLFLLGKNTVGGVAGMWWTGNRGATWNNMLGDWLTSIGSWNGIKSIAPVWIP